MLRQEPTECLFSFICTSNNHISRIQGMVERLCQALGTPLCKLDQTSYYSFPSLSALSGASSHLPTCLECHWAASGSRIRFLIISLHTSNFLFFLPYSEDASLITIYKVQHKIHTCHHCGCVAYYIVINRQQCGGTPQGSRFWIQSSVPAAECKADPGYPRNAVAGWSTHCSVCASSGGTAYPPWCGHQGQMRKDFTCFLKRYPAPVSVANSSIRKATIGCPKSH